MFYLKSFMYFMTLFSRLVTDYKYVYFHTFYYFLNYKYVFFINGNIQKQLSRHYFIGMIVCEGDLMD